MAKTALTVHGLNIRQACRIFGISETCYRYVPKLSDENAEIADWLNQYLFESIHEVQTYATRWLWTYNHERPNTAIGGITPNQKLDLAA